MRNNKSSKGIALAMASVMTLSMLPAINVHATTENTLSNGNINVAKKTMFYEPSLRPAPKVRDNSKVEHAVEGNYLTLEVKSDDIVTGASFEISLDNGKFAFQDWENYLESAPFDPEKGTITKDTAAGNTTYTRKNVDVDTEYLGVPVRDKDGSEYAMTVAGESSVANVSFLERIYKGETVNIPLMLRTNENYTKGQVKASISGRNGISSRDLIVAQVNSSGQTTVAVEDVQTAKNRISVNRITVKETVVGKMRPKDNDGFYLELPSGYQFAGSPGISKVNVDWDRVNYYFSNDNRKLNITFVGFKGDNSGLAGRVVITGLAITPNNTSNENVTSEDIKASIGNIGDSDMVSELDFLIGKRADYGVEYKADSVPTLINGYYDTSSRNNSRTKTAKLTISEQTVGSIVNGRDLNIELDTGDKEKTNTTGSVKINAVKIEDKENIRQAIAGTHDLGKRGDVDVRERKVILRGIENTSNAKAKFSISFYVSIESGYVGDIKAKVYGDGIGKNSNSAEQVVIAKAVNPINVTPATTYIAPAQTVELEDIVLTEQLNSKGESSLEEGKTVTLGFNNNNNYLSVVGKPTVNTEGGLKIKNVRVTNTNVSGSSLSFTVDTQSSKNKASKITISGLKVAASASIPQGTYNLVAGGSAIGGNSTSIVGSNSNTASFTTDGIAVARLQYGGKMSMKITVGDKIAVVNGQNVEMKMAPFIDPETGTTYMQVSDIVKATGMECKYLDNRLQHLPGMDETLFVTFGDRTFEKDKSLVIVTGQPLPETMMNEQGTPVNMIIKDDYTCLPLRYFVENVLGQKISWNGTDRSITIE